MSENQISDTTRIRIEGMTSARLKKYLRKRQEEKEIQEVHLKYCEDDARSKRIKASISGLNRVIELCEERAA